jgi:hypothetical protein
VMKWEPLYKPVLASPRADLIQLVFEALPMTRLFTVPQMQAYLDAVALEYRAQGVPLVDPEARKYEGVA